MPFNYLIFIFSTFWSLIFSLGNSCTHACILRWVLSFIYSIRLQHVTQECLFFSLSTKAGVCHTSFLISDTGWTETVRRIVLHTQNGIITQQKQRSSFWNQIPELAEKKGLFCISCSSEFFRGTLWFFLTKRIVPHWQKFIMCGYFSVLPQISRKLRGQQATAMPLRKQQLLFDTLQSADVSTDSVNKQLPFCTAEASCVNKTEFELLHAAVTCIEEGSTWLWPKVCGKGGSNSSSSAVVADGKHLLPFPSPWNRHMGNVPWCPSELGHSSPWNTYATFRSTGKSLKNQNGKQMRNLGSLHFYITSEMRHIASNCMKSDVSPCCYSEEHKQPFILPWGRSGENSDSWTGYIRTHHSLSWYYSSSTVAHQAQRVTVPT